MATSVYVTGTGMISAVGHTVNEAWEAICRNKSGVGPIRYLPTRHKGYLPAAEVRASNDELRDILKVSSQTPLTRTSLLAMIAAREATQSAGIDSGRSRPTGLVSATTVGGMSATERYFYDWLDSSKGKDTLQYVATHDCGDSTEKIADDLQIQDYVGTINTACSSSANAIMYAARLIRAGILDRAVAGGVDALTSFTLNGFNSLRILDPEPCKPFDNNRQGLNLGEGAAYVVLEADHVVEREEKEILAEVSGYGNSNDAYHQTASSPEGDGAYMAMEKALRVADLAKDEISYVNAHGTGTDNNDLSEGRALEKLFDGHMPPTSSTKAFTGHTLGAAGSVEAVFAIQAIGENKIMPNLNFSEQMEELAFQPVKDGPKEGEVHHILSNSFGFGGNNTSLVFSKV